ncbi:MFS transporter [Deinococcus sp.]|uniref:MFS transporter n=1 Tax=Deinococcus sp. TaxID=47478 RepID=UPI0025C4591C|nr:MFS transporter [Deinococcus sp.]
MTKTDQPKKSVLERLPLRRELAAGVGAAVLVLMFAEFVRSGFYMGFLARASEHYGLTALAVGSAWSAHLYTDTLMRGPAGVLIQRYGPKVVVMAGAAICLGALGLLTVSHAGWTLFVVAILHGVGFSPMWPATMNLTADAAKEGYQGRVLSLVSTSIMPMSGIGLFAFGILATRTAPQNVVLLALVTLGIGLALTVLMPRQRPAHIEQAKKEGKASRSVLHALAPLMPAALMQTLTQSMIGAWILSMAPKLGLSDWQLIVALVIGGAVAFGAMPFTGKFADRGKARQAVALGYALVGLAFLGFAFLPPLPVIFALAPVAGLGYAFLTPGWAALITQLLPEAQRPSAWGVLMTVESAGFAAGPLLGGLALSTAGPKGLFGLGAALGFLTALGYLLFKKYFQPYPQTFKTDGPGTPSLDPAPPDAAVPIPKVGPDRADAVGDHR